MKIRLLKDVQVTDHPGVKVGDVFDIAAERGEILVRVGAAELVEIKPAIQTRDPEIQNRDPEIGKPTSRRRQ